MASTPTEYDSSKFLSEEIIQKYILSYYSLENAEISQIKFKDTDKQRAVYNVKCENNSYCLKKVYYETTNLLFVYSATEWWYRNGINLPRILPTNQGGRFVTYNNMLFILTPWIEGEKCDYDNENHVFKLSHTLGKMHRTSKEFIAIKGSATRENYDVIFNSTYKHMQSLLNYSNLSFKYKDEFSKVYTQSFNESIQLAKLSCDAAYSINNKNLSKSLCHLDYVNKNLIFDENQNTWVIDFDKCSMDYCAHDISYALRRVLKRDSTSWDISLLLKFMTIYEKSNLLNVDDYKYILSYLAFPQKLWRISRDYYNNIEKCNKNAFLKLLTKAVKYHGEQLTLAINFKKYIEDRFNIEM